MKSKLISALREAYVKVLFEHGKLYHFDDGAEDQLTVKSGDITFTSEEAAVVNQLTNALYDEELFLLALKFD